MKQPEVSIIVPVYNVEKYLHQCLDSVVNQSLKDIEIIVINDGSKDSSLEIINEYTTRDKRVKVIDKANEGYGKTMNRGLDAATGKFIGIVESDDWIEPNMYETLYDLAMANDAEVVKCRFISFKNGTDKKHISSMPCDDAEKIIDPKSNPKIFFVAASIWAAIYDANFLRSNDIHFLESPGASYQDTGFNFKVLASAKRMYLSMQPLLHYRTGHSSQSTRSKDKVFCIFDEFVEIDRWMKQHHPEWIQPFEKVYNSVKANAYIGQLRRLSRENKEAFLERFREDFANVLNRHAIDTSLFNNKTIARLNKYINPTLRNKITHAWTKILRLFLKDDIHDGYMVYRLFSATICRREIKMDKIL